MVAALHDLILTVTKELKGLITTFVFDCKHPQAKIPEVYDTMWFRVCQPGINPEGMPNLLKLIPPELKINPYTGKPMEKTID